MYLTSRNGRLRHLPSNLLTRERLCSPFANVSGFYFRDTPLHAAATLGELDVIPWDCIESSDLELENQSGLSVLSVAALMENLEQVPRRFLTTQAVLRKDRAGMNGLLGCAACGCWDGESDLHPRPEGLSFLELYDAESSWCELKNRLKRSEPVGELKLMPWDEISPRELLSTVSGRTVVSYAIQSLQTDMLPTKLLTSEIMEAPGCPDEPFPHEPYERSLWEAAEDGYASVLRIPIPYLLEKSPQLVDLDLLQQRRAEVVQDARDGKRELLYLEFEGKPLHAHLNLDPTRLNRDSDVVEL